MKQVFDDMNSQQARPDWPGAVIAGAFQTGVLGVRSLVRRGVKTVSFDWDPRNSGFRSVYGRATLCPHPGKDPAGWLQFMKALGSKIGGKPVLICSSDQYVSAIAEFADDLADYFRLPPAAVLQGKLATKQTQYELATLHGMPMPRTQLVRVLDEVEGFARSSKFPCLLKPLHFREWQVFPAGHPLSYVKVAIAQTPADLARLWTLASAANPTAIVQEIIEGPDTDKRVYLACYGRSGTRIANAMFRELRCDPVGFGPASVSEPVVDAETDRVCDRWLRSIGYTGICEIEMKRDSRDGAVKLIEANPRLSGGGDAAPYAGVDLCWLHYLDMIGEPVTPVTPRAREFRHIVLRSDATTVIAYRRAGLISWSDVLRSYKPPLAFYDLDAKDLRYSAETLFVATRSAVGALLHSVGLHN